MIFSSFNGRGDHENNALGIVGICRVFGTQDTFFLEMIAFDRVQPVSSQNMCAALDGEVEGRIQASNMRFVFQYGQMSDNGSGSRAPKNDQTKDVLFLPCSSSECFNIKLLIRIIMIIWRISTVLCLITCDFTTQLEMFMLMLLNGSFDGLTDCSLYCLLACFSLDLLLVCLIDCLFV